MPLYFFYTMVQKSQKLPNTQIEGGSCLKVAQGNEREFLSLSFHSADKN